MKNYFLPYLLLFLFSNNITGQVKDTLYTLGTDGYDLLTKEELDAMFTKRVTALNNDIETKFDVLFDPIKEEIEGTTLIRYGSMHFKAVSIITDADRKGQRLNQKLPEFDFLDLNGNQISSEDLHEKVVLLNFWFTRCAPCIAEMPYLNQIKEDYSNKDILFISMAPEEKDKIEQFLKKHPFNFRHIPDADDLLKQFGTGFPKNILIDKKGIIRIMGTGLVSENEKVNQDFLRTEIDKLLAE